MKSTIDFHPADALLALTGPRPSIAIAFSGGVDSTALAHALVSARRRFARLRLLHVDHGLQSASPAWALHCARQAKSWRVPFVNLRAQIRKSRGESPEAAARAARYALLAGAMKPDDVLVTAQHRDDQVETLLLQLFRGAGVAGLAAMPAIASFGPGRIARPLLDAPRQAVLAYAKAQGLAWVDDPTNRETAFGRNYLRLRVLPAIRLRWPGVDSAIARSASHMSEARQLLEAQADRDLAAIADGSGINVAALRALPPARRRNLVRAFLVRAGLEPPQTNWLREILGPMLAARADAQPEIALKGGLLRRRAGRLEVEVNSEERTRQSSESGSKSWCWNTHRESKLSDAGDVLVLEDDDTGPVDLDKLPPTLEIRTRAGGETLRPGSSARTRSLKALLQSAKLSTAERARLPLLFAAERLVAAGDRWIDASIAADVKSRRRGRLRIRRHKR